VHDHVAFEIGAEEREDLGERRLLEGHRHGLSVECLPFIGRGQRLVVDARLARRRDEQGAGDDGGGSRCDERYMHDKSPCW
jgi:hypothetical protein